MSPEPFICPPSSHPNAAPRRATVHCSILSSLRKAEKEDAVEKKIVSGEMTFATPNCLTLPTLNSILLRAVGPNEWVEGNDEERERSGYHSRQVVGHPRSGQAALQGLVEDLVVRHPKYVARALHLICCLQHRRGLTFGWLAALHLVAGLCETSPLAT